MHNCSVLKDVVGVAALATQLRKRKRKRTGERKRTKIKTRTKMRTKMRKRMKKMVLVCTFLKLVYCFFPFLHFLCPGVVLFSSKTMVHWMRMKTRTRTHVPPLPPLVVVVVAAAVVVADVAAVVAVVAAGVAV